jgi:hypothetical protein
MQFKARNFCAAALALTACLGINGAALAAAKDYEFRLVDDELSQGEAIVAVTLVDKRTGAGVSDAVIFATRMDMAPDQMEAMTSPVEALPPKDKGVYRFKTTLTMAGNWRLSLAAKVLGEAETVVSRLVLKAVR